MIDLIIKMCIHQITADKYICGHFLHLLSEVDVFILRLTCRQIRTDVPQPSEFFNGLDDVMRSAANAGNLSLLRFAHEMGGRLFKWHGDAAIMVDSVDCLNYILTHNIYNKSYSGIAVRLNSINCLKHLNTNDDLSDSNLMIIAGENGNLECIKYLDSLKNHKMRSNLTYWSAIAGSLECIKYAISHGHDMHEMVSTYAASIGNLECLIYAYEHGSPITAQTVKQAATLECIEYAHKIYGSIPPDTCEIAVSLGRYDCLKYAHKNGCILNDRLIQAAALRGSLDCVKYLYENGCQINRETCVNAAASKSLLCLKYVCEMSKCKITYDIFINAAGSLECLKYLFSLEAKPNISLCEWATRNSKSDECLRFVRNLGHEWDTNTCYQAALYGSLACLKYAHENGCPWKEDTTNIAASCGHVNCLKYAINRGCPAKSTIFVNNYNNEYMAYYLRSIAHKFPKDDHVTQFLNTFNEIYC